VLEEPSTIAIGRQHRVVAAIGAAAGPSRTRSEGHQVIHPLRDGVIADLDATAEMLPQLPAQVGRG